MGGPTLVIGAVASFFAKRYLDHSLEKEKALHSKALEEQKGRWTAALEYDKELYAAALEEDRNRYAAAIERQKVGSEKHIYIYKTQFDVEFNAYRELWSKLAKLIDSVAVLVNYSRYSNEAPESLKATKNASAKKADAAFFAANHANNQLIPFIDVHIHELIARHNRLCKDEIDTFFFGIESPKETNENVDYDPQQDYEETKAALASIEQIYEEIGTAIRTRLGSLLVLDE